MSRLILSVLLAVFVSSHCKVYYEEDFSGDWQSKWVQSSNKGDDQGAIDSSAGKFWSGDEAAAKGLHTVDDMRFYTQSTKMTEEFNTEGKTLVFQFTFKLPEKFECGGGYVKLMPTTDQANWNGDSDYAIMFGPDICGYDTKKVHVIFSHKGKNLLKTEEVKLDYNEKDEFTHLYTLVMNADRTYTVSFDGAEKASGKLEDDWEFLEPKEIDDPTDSKPDDWEEEAMIADPTDVKPEGHDNISEKIVDPEAKKPEDWDDDMDGDWEAPEIDNPEFKGEWVQKQMENPKYKGIWAPRKIANPDYKEDPTIGNYKVNTVGLEVWQVNGGTVLDNVLVTDDVDYAKAQADKIDVKTIQENEKKMKEEQDAAAAPPAEEAEAEADEEEEEEDTRDEL